MWDGYEIDTTVDPETEHIHSLGDFHSVLVEKWFVRRLFNLFEHLGFAWSHRMIKIL